MGDDLIEGGGGDDFLYGGAGNDRLYATGRPVTDGKLLGVLPPGFDYPHGAYLNGEAGNDKLYASGADDTLLGGQGNDSLYGGYGEDVLDGGVGKDVLYGQGDDDTYYLRDKADRIVEKSNEGNDTVYTWVGTYKQNLGITYTLSKNFENLELRGKVDSAYGNVGDNQITGNEKGNFIFGETGNDILNGGKGKDYLDGGPGNDIVFGGSGNDILLGGAGDDILYGEIGKDSFIWSPGTNAYFGGLWEDVFFVNADPGDSVTVIMDFNHDDDTIMVQRNGTKVSFRDFHFLQTTIADPTRPIVNAHQPTISVTAVYAEEEVMVYLLNPVHLDSSDFAYF
jgi:Ca2+-binding RTX toxin-like protein